MKEQKKRDQYSTDLTEKFQQLWQDGYASIVFLEKAALDSFNKDPQHVKKLIVTYYFGTAFSHVDAYELCSLGKTWPEFCIHPTEREFVLLFMKVNNTTGVTKYAVAFEKWIDQNRQQLCKDVAQNLSIDWTEIEKLKDDPLLFLM